MKDFEREIEGWEDLSYKYLGVEIDNPLKLRRYVLDMRWICDICNHMNFPTGEKLSLTWNLERPQIKGHNLSTVCGYKANWFDFESIFYLLRRVNLYICKVCFWLFPIFFFVHVRRSWSCVNQNRATELVDV